MHLGQNSKQYYSLGSHWIKEGAFPKTPQDPGGQQVEHESTPYPCVSSATSVNIPCKDLRLSEVIGLGYVYRHRPTASGINNLSLFLYSTVSNTDQ